MTTCFTFDLHDTDYPDDIIRCNDLLLSQGIKGTFFLPTALLKEPRYREPFRRLSASGHQLGTHSHTHSFEEIKVLKNGSEREQQFLVESAHRFADYFGRQPECFRAPCWVRPNASAYGILAELGYLVDSSACPQRLGLLSSFPRENPWLFAPRKPNFIQGGLMEIPTSCFLFPLSINFIRLFRRSGTWLFIKLLQMEIGRNPNVPVNIMFHVSDFASQGEQLWWHRAKWTDLIPTRNGGFKFKYWLQVSGRERVYKLSMHAMQLLMKGECKTLGEVRANYSSMEVMAPMHQQEQPAPQSAVLETSRGRRLT